MTLAQLDLIPANPTLLWILAAAIVLGALIMGRSVSRGYKVVETNQADTRIAVSTLMGHFETTTKQLVSTNNQQQQTFERTMDKVCDTHHETAKVIANSLDNFRSEFVKHSERVENKLGEIHSELK